MTDQTIRPDKVSAAATALEGVLVRTSSSGLSASILQYDCELIMKPGTRAGKEVGSIINIAMAKTDQRFGPLRGMHFVRQKHRGRFFNPMEITRAGREYHLGHDELLKLAVLKTLCCAYAQRGSLGYQPEELKKYLFNFGTKVLDFRESEVMTLLSSCGAAAQAAPRPAVVTPFGKVEWAPRRR